MNESIKDDMTQELAFMEAYDTAFQIHDHDATENPFSIIGHHPAEDMATGDSVSHLMAELITYRLPEVTNTPLLSLMETYPRWRLDKLIEQCKKAKTREDGDLKKTEEQLTSIVNKMNG